MRQRVLIIKLGALGDLVLATSHIEKISRHHSTADVELLTAPEYTDLFQAHPDLGVTAFPRAGFRAMLSVLRWIRRQQFDAVYDLQGSVRSRLFTRWSGAPVRIGLRSHAVYTVSVPQDDRARHIFERLNRLLGATGIAPADPSPVVHVSADDERMVMAWLREHSLERRRFVLVHAGSSERWASKRWEEAHYRAFAQEIIGAGLETVWTGSAADAGLNGRLAEAGGIDASGRFTLRQLAALARQARFALATDSGPMHVFASAGIPVYALFGPTDWRRCHATGQATRVLTHAVPCSPCYLGTCPPARAHRCLRELTADQVVRRLHEDELI